MDFDKNFWEETYKRNIEKLTGLCYRYVGNVQISEDIAHDSFLKAMEKRDSFKKLGHFDAWLRKITLNNALQHIKKEKKNREEKKSIILDGINNIDDEKLSQDFTLHQLLAAINELPEHHKMVFNLYVIDEYSHREIAQKLNISEGTSKSHLSRAKRKLREILNKKKKNRYFMLFILPCRRRKTKKKLRNFSIINNKEIFTDNNYTNYKSPEIGTSKLSIFFKIGLPLLIISSIVYIFNKNNNPTTLEEVENKTIEYKSVDADSLKNEEPLIIKKQIVIRKTVTDTIKITNE